MFTAEELEVIIPAVEAGRMVTRMLLASDPSPVTEQMDDNLASALVKLRAMSDVQSITNPEEVPDGAANHL